MTELACLTCGRPFRPASRRQRRCPAHQRAARTGAWQGSTHAWRRVRQHVLERDGYRCQWCGAPATEADHLFPKSRGGSDDPSNLVAACGSCNRQRGATPATPVAVDVDLPPLPRGFTVGQAFVVLIGPPAAGKSTWAAGLPDGPAVLGPDEHIDGPWSRAAYGQALSMVLDAAGHAARAGRGVVFDTTGSSSRLRGTLRALARQHERPLVGVLVLPVLAVCLERNARRRRRTPEALLARIYSQVALELPRIAAEPWAALHRLEEGGGSISAPARGPDTALPPHGEKNDRDRTVGPTSGNQMERLP